MSLFSTELINWKPMERYPSKANINTLTWMCMCKCLPFTDDRPPKNRHHGGGGGSSGKAVDSLPLQWHHNEHDGVSNHWRLHCLLNRLFRRKSNKTSKLTSLASVREIHPWPVDSPHKGPVTRNFFHLMTSSDNAFCNECVDWNGDESLWWQ